VERQIRSVRISQTGQRRCVAEAQGRPCGLAELGTCQDRAVVGKADDATVERGIPKGGEKEPVVHVEALHVRAIGPWHNVGGSEQRWLGDAGDWAAAAPVIHQGVSKNVLADALDHQPLGFGRSGKIGCLGLEAIKWRFRQAHRELVDTIERGVQLTEVREHKGRKSRTGLGRGGHSADLRGDTGMVD
jgi:hypothetical protein